MNYLNLFLSSCIINYFSIKRHRDRSRKFMRKVDFFKMCKSISKLFLCSSYANLLILFVKSSSLNWGVPYINLWIKKITQKGTYTFLNTLSRVISLIIIVLIRSITMLNIIMENENKSSTYIPFSLRDLGRRSWYLFLFPLKLFEMTNFLKLKQLKIIVKSQTYV